LPFNGLPDHQDRDNKNLKGCQQHQLHLMLTFVNMKLTLI
jgi:hypothetical protein